MLSINVVGMRESLSFCFLVATLVVVIGLSLFLVVRLFLRLRTSTIEKPKMKESLMFGAFVAS